MPTNRSVQKRYSKSLEFIKRHIPPPNVIVDLGTENPFTRILKDEGYSVMNTGGEDLDIAYDRINDHNADAVIALEIFEHLAAPFNILRTMKHKKLIASVPLKLWFASAYWNEKDDWDKHYHEFEIKQFDWLLKKTGWQIKDRAIWKSAEFKLGIRPLLRFLYPRYYIVYCERI